MSQRPSNHYQKEDWREKISITEQTNCAIGIRIPHNSHFRLFGIDFLMYKWTNS